VLRQGPPEAVSGRVLCDEAAQKPQFGGVHFCHVLFLTFQRDYFRRS
jgi:hypothetical protein